MRDRPDPETLLARVQAEETQQRRGRLKIFFGAAAGVGKTYAMLEAAREKRAEGVDVVVGYVEPHGRHETEALLDGLECLPPRTVEYRGVTLREFDLDAALARRPQLILVDELAHTNAPGSRHARRWQDIEELLAAGIDVYTTVNVQHIESLNDVVAQITGVVVRETVPDRVLDEADEVELIDLPPDDLLQRLREGKVYMPQQAGRALSHFFRKGNLIALRELALRRTAERVDAQMDAYRRDHAITEPWPAAERILVGVDSSPAAARLVRAARRMAASLRAEWIVAYVETPAELRLPETEREQAMQTLRLAEQLGAQTVTLSGANAADELVAYARSRNISKIVIGKPERPRWQDLLFGSVADDLLRKSGVVDVYVLSGDYGDTEPPLAALASQPAASATAYAWSAAAIGLVTAALFAIDSLFPSFAEANTVMLYLLAVVGVAMRYGRGPAVLASVLSVLAFDFLFIPPQWSFAVSDTQYILTFVVMLAVALVSSNLTVRFRQQAEAARQRERRTAALYAFSRELAGTRGLEQLLQATVRHIHEVFDSQVLIYLTTASGRLQPWGSVSGWWSHGAADQIFAPDSGEQGVAEWAFRHGEPAGLGTGTLPSAKSLYLPLAGSQGAVGVLGVRPKDPRRFQAPEQLHLLETFAAQAALAIERAILADAAQRAQLRAETERMRASLLSSVSHDLRTPLAVITGATSSLLEGGATLDPATRDELARTAYEEAVRLNRLVSNLLDMTRLEAGALQPHREWQPLEEVVGAAVARAEAAAPDHPITVRLPDDLPPLAIDAALIEQVLLNLLDNAAKHSPAGTPVELSARRVGETVEVSVADRGPGLPPGAEERVFEKFYRGAPDGGRGAGLGLSICRGMIEAHGGRMWAEQRPGGGAVFRFTLPLAATPQPV